MGDLEKLDKEKIGRLLGRRGADIVIYGEVDSTNDQAKRLVSQGTVGEAVIAAEKQTAGRGRQGKSFYSPEGSGLYMTVVLRPRGELSDFTLITSAAATAVSQAIESISGRDTQIKWVNDVCIDGKKAVGILTEAVTSGQRAAVIVGIGVNITTDAFPPEIADRACSLVSDTSTDISRNVLAAEIAKRLFELCDKLPEDRGYMEYYRSRSCVIGRRIVFTDGGREYSALATAIDDGGGLRILLDSGEERLLCGGEISVKAI